jgi:hypothetical protein
VSSVTPQKETFVEEGNLQAGFECSGGDQNAYLFQGDVTRIAVKIVGHWPSLPGNHLQKHWREYARGTGVCES